MNRWLVVSLIIFITSCGPANQSKVSGSKAPPNNPEDLERAFDDYFTALTSLRKFNGVICVAKDDKILLNKAYNINADIPETLVVNKDSQFDIHSISKLMANYLLIRLETQGIIAFSDPLAKYINGFPNGNEITIDHLINHTSGLPRELSAVKGKLLEKTAPEIIDLIKQEKQLTKPGEAVQYSNLGYQLMYYIIGHIHKCSFEDYLIREFFEPLQMNDSGARFNTSKDNLHSMAINHEVEEEEMVRIENVLEDEFQQSRIFSSSKDLQRMLSFFRANDEASGMARENVIQHSGGSDGVRAHVFTDIEKDIDVVLLCNFDGIPFQQTVKDIMSMVNGDKYDLPKAINRQSTTLAKNILKRYEGSYVFPDMNKLKLTFTALDGTLAVDQEGEGTSVLYAEDEHTFFADPKEPESFEFIKNDDGQYMLLMGWKGVKLNGYKEK